MESYRAGPSGTSGFGVRRQYLSFQLGGLEYGLDFSRVQELRPFKELERFASDGVLLNGVGVSRGVIMPIVDMRCAFSSVVAAPEPATDVIILRLSDCVVGMVVDGVTDIVGLRADDIYSIPGAGATEDVSYLLGIGQADGRRLILIDIEQLMSIRQKHAAGQRAA